MENKTSVQPKDTEKQKKLGKRNQVIVWFILLILLAVIMGLGGFGTDNFEQICYRVDLISEPVSLRQMTVSAESGEQTQSKNHLSVWVENSPSMAGFISSGKDNCPISFFEYMLNTNSIGQWVPNDTRTTFYRFSSILAYDLEKQGIENLEQLRNDSKLSVEATRNQSFCYEFDDVRERRGNALAAVLSVLDLEQPSIIITDFLESADALQKDTLLKACERIFKNNYTISVIALDGMFSGAIYDSGLNDEEIFTVTAQQQNDRFIYNRENVQIKTSAGTRLQAKEIVTPYTYHRHIRPMYILVVGTAAQCDSYSDMIVSHYDEYREKMRNGYTKEEPEKAHSNLENGPLFRDAQKHSIGQIGILQKLVSVDKVRIDNKVLSHDGDCAETRNEIDYYQVPLHAEGVDAYRLSKDAGKASQRYTIRYSIRPDIEQYSVEDRYLTSDVRKSWLVFTPYKGSDTSVKTVKTLGNRTLTYKFEDFSDQNRAFRISDCIALEEEVQFDVTIDVSALEKGYYRLEIPVVLERQENNDDLNTVFKDWNIARVDAKKAPSATADLLNQLRQISDAKSYYAHNRVTVAIVTIDIEVAEPRQEEEASL